ncbi:MAG: disulfide bond formation protein B [Rhodospirillales bacterium]|nr:disulfide bond formation protein B [Alphaproteobacteria bacterium]USO03016.1 MAG: disulfide bond formation protein B [Rhodospirillales bacterium]
MIKNIFLNAQLMTFGLAAISAFALSMAFTAQYIFGLEPCILCLYQRIPYALVIALGLTGFLTAPKCKLGAAFFIILSGFVFLANSALAFYHSGIEQHWWRSHLEGCAVPELEGSITDVLATIEARTEAVRCDEPSWLDPVFGLSMANYNAAFCFGLFALCLLSGTAIWRKAKADRAAKKACGV